MNPTTIPAEYPAADINPDTIPLDVCPPISTAKTPLIKEYGPYKLKPNVTAKMLILAISKVFASIKVKQHKQKVVTAANIGMILNLQCFDFILSNQTPAITTLTEPTNGTMAEIVAAV